MVNDLSSKGLPWTDIAEPDNEELAEFIRKADLDPGDAEFVVREHQRPEVAVRENYVLILIHVPQFDRKHRVTSGVSVYFLITENQFWTLHYEPVTMLDKVIEDAQKLYDEDEEDHEEYSDKTPINLALSVIYQLNVGSFKKINKLAKHIEIAEDAVFHGNERKMVEEIAVLARDVLDFRKIVRPQVGMFEAQPTLPFGGDTAAQWHRLARQTNQMWDVLKSLYDSTIELRDTNDSLLQHKENAMLRMLTLYSIITIPAWVLVTPLSPHSDLLIDRVAFWGIFGVVTVLLFLIFFRLKRKGVL